MSLEAWSRQQSQFFNTGVRNRPSTPGTLRGPSLCLAYAVCGLPVLLGFAVPFMQLLVWASITYDTILTRDFAGYLFNSVTLAAITAIAALALLFRLQRQVSSRTHKGLNESLCRYG